MKRQLPGALVLAYGVVCLLQCVVYGVDIQIGALVNGSHVALRNIFAVSGDNVTIRCEVRGVTSDTNIVWENLFGDLQTDDRISIHPEPLEGRGDTSMDVVSVLTITSVSTQDSGHYTCLDRQGLAGPETGGIGKSADTCLTVFSIPVCSPSGSKTVFDGEDTMINCTINEEYTPVNVSITSPNVDLSEELWSLDKIGDTVFGRLTWVANRSQDGIVFRCDVTSSLSPDKIRSCSTGPISVVQRPSPQPSMSTTVLGSFTENWTTGLELSTTKPPAEITSSATVTGGSTGSKMSTTSLTTGSEIRNDATSTVSSFSSETASTDQPLTPSLTTSQSHTSSSMISQTLGESEEPELSTVNPYISTVTSEATMAEITAEPTEQTTPQDGDGSYGTTVVTTVSSLTTETPTRQNSNQTTQFPANAQTTSAHRSSTRNGKEPTTSDSDPAFSTRAKLTPTQTEKKTDHPKDSENSKSWSSSPPSTTPSNPMEQPPSSSPFTGYSLLWFTLFIVAVAVAVLFVFITVLLYLKITRMSRYSWNLKTEAFLARNECERQKVVLKGMENGAFIEIPLNDINM